MFKTTFATAALFFLAFGATVHAVEFVLSSNVIDGYESTSFFTSAGSVSPNNGITNSRPGQRFNSGAGGLFAGLETIIGRESDSQPLMISIHESEADLPGAVLGSITVPATSVPEYNFSDTPFTRFDLTSLDLELAPNTDYFASFGSVPSNDGFGNFSMRVIDPLSGHGQDYAYSRNGGLSWDPPGPFQTGELPLTVFGRSAALELTPSVDARAELLDGAYEIDAAATLLTTQQIDFADIDRRVILEFTLPNVPDNQRVVGAELELDVGSFSSSPGEYPVAQIYGYVGDGVATPDDALETSLPVGMVGPVMELNPTTSSLDADWFNMLLAEDTQEVGLLLVGGDNSRAIGFYSSEAFIPDVRAAPLLKLTFQDLGDFDLDGDVDLDDLDRYIGNLGAAATGDLAALDLDGDGTVGANDFQQHYETLVGTSNGGVGTFAGDINLDGTVDVLGDAFALIGNLGNSVVSWAEGDINGDGNVDVLGDAFLLIGNLGNSNDAGAASAAVVPEPSGISFLALIGLLSISKRRRN